LENENLEDSDCFRLRKKPICVVNKPELKEKQLQEWVDIFLNSFDLRRFIDVFQLSVDVVKGNRNSNQG
jgi:hypothetical protein